MKEHTVENSSKKIKLEQKLISEKIDKDFPDMDIQEHEINKFILIFHTLLNTSLKDNKLSEVKALDAEDSVQDTILLIVSKLITHLKGNINSLKLPAIIKKD